MMARRTRFPVCFPAPLPAALAVLAAVAAAGCSAPEKRSASGMRDLDEGVITFFDPAPTVRSGRAAPRVLPPATIVVTTRTEGGKTVEGTDQVLVVRGKVGERSRKDLVRELWKEASRKQRKVVSRKRFREIWRQLVDLGLLELPAYRGEGAPQGTAWIRVQAEGREAYFLKPVRGFREVRPQRELELNRIWHLATVLLTSVE